MNELHNFIEQCKFEEALELLSTADASELVKKPYKDDLPLHMACERRAPDDLILDLLHLHEEAVSVPGRSGMVPLHIAAQRNLNADIIEALIRVNPRTLDLRNASKYTPRDYGHQDPVAFQAINRPTSCWIQLIDDEIREEEQDSKILKLHKQVDDALKSLQVTDTKYQQMMTRLQRVEMKLIDYDDQTSVSLERKFVDLENTLKEKTDRVETLLCTVEDDAKAANARDFMARAASRAHRRDVIKMQEESAKEAETLRNEVEEVKKIVSQ